MTTGLSLRKPIYLVFHDKGERYYLDSMLQLNLEQYLYLLLRRENYKAIFFFDVSANEQITIRAADYRAYCRNQIPYKIFQKSLWQTDCNPERYPLVVYQSTCNKNLTDWILGCLSESGTAIVGDIASVNTLFRKMDEKAREKLLSYLTDIRKSGTLIITGPMELDQKLHEEYTGEKSLLMHAGGDLAGGQAAAAVFPQFRRAVKDGQTDVFSLLKEQYNHQVMELGTLNTADVHGVLVHAAFSSERFVPENELRDCAGYIAYWLRCPELRKDAGNLFGESTSLTRKELYQHLAAGGFEAVRNGVEEQRQWYREQCSAEGEPLAMSELLKLRYGDLYAVNHDTSSSIRINDAVLKKAMQMIPVDSSCFSDYSQTEFNIIMPAAGEWLQMLKNAAAPASVWPEQKRIEQIDEFLNIYESAYKKNDIDTLKRTINVLFYCIGHLYATRSEEYEQYCQRSDTYLTTSKLFRESQKEIRVLENQLRAEEAADCANAVLRVKIDYTVKRIGIYRKLLKNCDITLRQMASVDEKSFAEIMKLLQTEMAQYDDEISTFYRGEQPDEDDTPQAVVDARGLRVNPAWY